MIITNLVILDRYTITAHFKQTAEMRLKCRVSENETVSWVKDKKLSKQNLSTGNTLCIYHILLSIQTSQLFTAAVGV